VTLRPEQDDEQEFEDFVRRDGPGLLRFGLLLTGNAATAEDLVQNALTNTYAHWSRARRADPGPYVRRAMVNDRTSTWRRLRRETPLPDTHDQPVATDAYGQSDERMRLVAALAELTLPQRTALVLRYLEGWDDAAIAGALGVRRATVRSQVKRGLAALRTALDDTALADLDDPAQAPTESLSLSHLRTQP
jgi:RNA polymerase sigma-70 factor (sigma-E family)